MGADRNTNSHSDDLEPEILPTEDAHLAAGVPSRLDLGTAVDGRYRIERVLGAGGMGAVYLATDLLLERPVALKMIRSDMAANPRMAALFRREAVAVARLRHPNIVTVHDYGVAPEAGAYIVMELLEGHSLRHELMRRAPMDPRVALELVRQACEAVGAAHRAGVIHLDLKPENIVLESDGRTVAIKVVDFGLAQLEAALRSDAESVPPGQVTFGTPAYMSPEQCAAESVDARSDIYSLGCVLFEMLTGRPPFLGRPAMTLLYKHVNEAPPRPSELHPAIAPRLDDVLGRALAKHPDGRFQSMEAFERALRAPGDAEASALLVRDGDTQEIELMTTVDGAWFEAEPPNNLPQSLTRFVGRSTQIEEVLERLTEARLVTLVGPGGIGKTRLSLEVAGRSRGDYEGGIWFIELASLADPALVSHAVAAVLGVREEAGQPTNEAIVAWLRDRRVLLVLDNCEHLVDACAAMAEDLLRVCSGLRVLASSREALGIAGEAVFIVPALSVPDAGEPASEDSVARFESTRMFVERAALCRPGFVATSQNAASIAEACRRLDGIPLAIELAAACVTALSVAQIAERLDDRFRLLTRGSRTAPQRQQTLRAAIDWSHDLLSDVERTLLRRLSVFAGGFTYEAAELVAAFDVLEPLNRLVGTSFVQADERPDGSLRYRMFESVREYADEKLREAGEAMATRDRHREWSLRLAAVAEPLLTGPKQAEWVARLEEEHDNMRSVLRWSVESGDAVTGLSLCFTLGRFWSVRGYVKEGRSWLDRVLSISDATDHPKRPRVLLWDSQLSRLEADLPHARARLDESQNLATAIGDDLGIEAALLERSTLEFQSGNLDEGVDCANRAMLLSEALGHQRGIGLALTSLGNICCERGDYERGTELFERALVVHRQLGDLRGMGTILSNLGRLVAMRGDFVLSRDLLAEGLAVSTELGDRTVVAFCLNSLGLVATQAGDLDDATTQFTRALVLFRELNVLNHIAEVFESMGTVAVLGGDAIRASVLIGAASEIRGAACIPLSSADRYEVDADLDAARQMIGVDAVDRTLDDGRNMRLDEAIAYATTAQPLRTDTAESDR